MNTPGMQLEGGQASLPLRSPHMERVAKALAARHGLDWTQPGAYLSLTLPGQPECWLLINLDGARFSVTGCLVEEDNSLTPEVDMVFTLHPDGWEPVELLYGNDVFVRYQQAATAAGLPVYDGEGNLRFDSFTAYFAHQLEAQGWLSHSQRGPDPLARESSGRMAGCQSTNHADCYGELWQCAACGKTVCYAEGTDDHPDLCDECWAARFTSPGDHVTPGVPFREKGTFVLVCDCPERCGTVLRLTPDGFLVLEDRDGLQVSFMLPDWLDFAIRRALLVNTPAADDEANTQMDYPGWSRLEDDVPF